MPYIHPKMNYIGVCIEFDHKLFHPLLDDLFEVRHELLSNSEGKH